MQTHSFSNRDAQVASDFAILSWQGGRAFPNRGSTFTATNYAAGISGAASAVSLELQGITAVDSIFCERDQDGVLHVFVVVREHDDAVYDAVIEAEDRISKRVGGAEITYRIRAHQGRDPRTAVPVGSEPVFVR